MSHSWEFSGLTKSFVSALRDWPAADPVLIQQCRFLLVDGVACAVTGSTERGPTIAAELVRERTGAATSTVIGKGFLASDIEAARVNGIAMHVLDFEPMWKPANHALSTILPAILALCERLEREGKGPQGGLLLTALAKGIETQGRLRYSSGQYLIGDLKFHPPGIVGPLASAVACAHVLGLDLDQTIHAVGIATSRAAGILVNVGSMTKALHCGDAAAHGLEAALLAHRGFTANPDALSGHRGYVSAFFDPAFDPSVLTRQVETPRAISPGPAWKLFPAQYATHYAITAALDCRDRISDLSAITAIEAVVPRMPYIDRPSPGTGLEGKFSFQYAIVAALLDGKIDVHTYADTRRFAVDMQSMLDKVTLIFDPAIPDSVDAMHLDLRIFLRDGGVIEHRCDAPLGSWTRPVPRSALDAKARALLSPAVGSARADQLLHMVHGGQEFRVTDLLDLISGPN